MSFVTGTDVKQLKERRTNAHTATEGGKSLYGSTYSLVSGRDMNVVGAGHTARVRVPPAKILRYR